VRRSEEGQLTLFVVLLTVALLVLAALVIDGGYILAARRRALDEAGGAARAGAQALAPSAYRSSGSVELDVGAAQAAAEGFLGATGHSGTVTVSGDRVVVTVTFDQPMAMLDIIGIDEVTVNGRGHARAVRGIETGEGL
jgi:hypothetical protein